MLVTCWSTKGGSGTTVIATLASLHAAQGRDRPVLLVDLCGDLPAVFGSAEKSSGVGEWLRSELAPRSPGGGVGGVTAHRDGELGEDDLRGRRAAEADRSVLVTRACYLALRRTVSLPVRPSGVVLVSEAGRALTRSDCERAIGAPVLATVAVDPDIARAVDAGMLRTRVPKGAIKALGRLTEEL